MGNRSNEELGDLIRFFGVRLDELPILGIEETLIGGESSRGYFILSKKGLMAIGMHPRDKENYLCLKYHLGDVDKFRIYNGKVARVNRDETFVQIALEEKDRKKTKGVINIYRTMTQDELVGLSQTLSLETTEEEYQDWLKRAGVSK